MFTIAQIKEAHAKVKSGADFPRYVQDLITLGVKKYETYVEDGHSIYYGVDGSTQQSEAKYAPLQIAQHNDKETFVQNLKAHQNGETDYMTFCRQAAAAGVEKWVTDTHAMTCTYYSSYGSIIFTEAIPE